MFILEGLLCKMKLCISHCMTLVEISISAVMVFPFATNDHLDVQDAKKPVFDEVNQ